MKKLAVVCMVLMIAFTGCSSEKLNIMFNPDSSKYHGNIELGDNHNMLTRIVDAPDGWQTAEWQCFYYDINTNTIYIGTANLNTYGSFVYKLESAEYRCYTYNTETGEFIGHK